MRTMTVSDLRPTARVAVLSAAIGSAAFTLRAGRSAPRLLLVAIVMWVLAPFVAVAFVEIMSKRWSAPSRLMLHTVMVVLAVVSLAVYGAELFWPHNPPAFMFVVVPPVSCLLMAAVAVVAALISGRQSPRTTGGQS
jgi:hypothetical protein